MDNDPIKRKEGTTNNDGAGSELQLPDGANVNIYDYGERSFDRFTAVYLDNPDGIGYMARGMSERPCSPLGFGQMCVAMDGPHLGKNISFKDLPIDCQKLVINDLT